MKKVEPLLEKHCKGKDVLEIGCVGQAYKFRIHEAIKKTKPSFLMGIDIQKDGIENGKKLGHNVEAISIEDEAIDRKFDVIVMTEVIEHLNNCGRAIENIKKMMNKDSILIITTPNCFAPKWLQQIQSKGKTNTNIDHVMWFDRQTLTSLFGRFNMKIQFLGDILHATIIAIVRRNDV